ncbi:DUF6314 family protein [Streptomyces cinnamoneus]|uniref:DUF6314 domain-containing protein n=1 Tax=Streptomyces cinnamoneus TaxID=53446 RepID=A0A918TFU4_STRCJ|nr:DUF6314 family protein [Streptomyces cinnamoneus]GHC44276.1 hypothetical protein GCM10010507_19060 [Streptomyces cinnamoneus]
MSDAVAHLTGDWTVERVLFDLAADRSGSFHGTAVFGEADDGRLVHTEDGELQWEGATSPAGRTLMLLPAADGTCEVLFSDGRFFHELDLRTGHWTVSHACAADSYEGTFDVVSRDEWHVCWRTTGPTKDHLQRSIYRRRVVPGP